MTPPKNAPGSPKYAIPKHVADIALKYGTNVSKGIQAMEQIISGYKPKEDLSNEYHEERV